MLIHENSRSELDSLSALNSKISTDV